MDRAELLGIAGLAVEDALTSHDSAEVASAWGAVIAEQVVPELADQMGSRDQALALLRPLTTTLDLLAVGNLPAALDFIDSL